MKKRVRGEFEIAITGMPSEDALLPGVMIPRSLGRFRPMIGACRVNTRTITSLRGVDRLKADQGEKQPRRHPHAEHDPTSRQIPHATNDRLLHGCITPRIFRCDSKRDQTKRSDRIVRAILPANSLPADLRRFRFKLVARDRRRRAIFILFDPRRTSDKTDSMNRRVHSNRILTRGNQPRYSSASSCSRHRFAIRSTKVFDVRSWRASRF